MIDNIELPDGAVVKYLPASAGSLVQTCGLGRFHIPGSN